MMPQTIYFDYNATTPLDPRVAQAMIPMLHSSWANPASSHFEGQQAKAKLEESRKIIANYFQVQPKEIIFTSGGTEGAHLLIHGSLALKNKAHIITSMTEHPCVFQTVKQLEKQGHPVTYLMPNSGGRIEAKAVEKAICANTKLIVLMAANNETGVKNEWEKVAQLAEYHQISFVLDGVGLLGKERFALSNGVTAAFFSGHKIYAPKGIGFCICRSKTKITPTFLGGHQEFGKRAGTPNLMGVVALAAAIKIVEQEQEVITAHMKKMRDLLEKELLCYVKGVVVNGEEPRVVNTTNLSFTTIDGENLLIQLDLAGICASHGSACSSGALEPSQTLVSMGLSLNRVRSAIRFSLGKMTTEQEVKYVIKKIIEIVN